MSSHLLDNLPAQYSTVYSTIFSPGGEYLVAGNHCGIIAVFKLDTLLSRSSDLTPVHSCFSGNEKGTPIYSFARTEDYLIAGTVGEILAWQWKDLSNRGGGTPEVKWRIVLPPVPGTAVFTEVNWMVVDTSCGTAGRLIVAGGDNAVHIYDLETREEIRSLLGHENYLHGVSFCPKGGLIVSGSEDGTVRLWDSSKKQPQINTIEPFKNQNLNRPKFGKWIGAVEIASDWIVCGGGPRAALWHLRSMAPNELLPPVDHPVTVLNLLDDRIIIGGLTNTMYQADYTGHILAEIPTTPSCIYSISTQEENIKVLVAAGSSSKIDLCTPNFSYKDQTITFPSK